MQGLSLVAASGDHSSSRCAGLSLSRPLLERRLQTRRLSSCGSQAQLLRCMWDLPRPGLEPVSPALAGRFSATAPPGKPPSLLFKKNFIEVYLIYDVLIPAVQQSDSVIHVHILFHIRLQYGLSQDIENSSLYCTVGPCCLSVLYIIACIC